MAAEQLHVKGGGQGKIRFGKFLFSFKELLIHNAVLRLIWSRVALYASDLNVAETASEPAKLFSSFFFLLLFGQTVKYKANAVFVFFFMYIQGNQKMWFEINVKVAIFI